MEPTTPQTPSTGAEANQTTNGANANAGGAQPQQGTPPSGQPNSGGAPASEDYKVKFGESSKEGLRLLDILKANNIDPKTGKSIQQQPSTPAGDTVFTDEELEASFPSFQAMSPQDKAIVKQVGSIPAMARMVAEMHDRQTFSDHLESIKSKPENKLIAENEKEFKTFAYQEGNLKIDINVLADAFIGKKLREQAAAQGNSQPQQPRPGMEGGSVAQPGTGNGSPEMTSAQAADLRVNNPQRYNELVRTGKLKITD